MAFDPPSTLKPAEVAVAMVEAAVMKHNTRYDKIFFKAFMAGVMLSFGGLLSEIIQGGAAGLNASNPGIVKVLGGFVFPVGLVMIVLQGQELLTNNMMVFPMACIKGAVPWWGLLVNWIIVTFGNLVGCLFFAAILVKYTGIISTAPYDAFAVTFAMWVARARRGTESWLMVNSVILRHKASDPEWHQIFLRGIGCNWLVSIAIWVRVLARCAVCPSDKSVASCRITRDDFEDLRDLDTDLAHPQIFVSAGYDHVVANMFSVPLGIMFHADLTTAEYIRKSLIAAYIGNIVGALFVALPAVYFYLDDWRAAGLADAEAGEAFSNMEVERVKVSEVRSQTSDNGKSSDNGKRED
ncbi:hypothetical protein EWM64_g1664 [Hericium alpestre]|uniref:Formate/nitrite transporter n=1 Tax=Hericium alpestre TaxID=135208 RepID=A0A4Z0A9Y1_9AGAM|nr:hypothetical protein EWM64_g1664 [Hericium alpestre]